MSLPLLRGGITSALYPFQRTATYVTRLQAFQNGSEQRWKTRGCLMELDLPYSKLVQSDNNSVAAAVASAKGTFDSTLSMALGSTTYANLGLQDDAWTGTETVNTQYGTSLKLRQTRPQAVTPAVPTGTPTYPTLSSGAAVMLPYSRTSHYSTLRNDMESGPRYAYSYFGSGLTNFPTRGLKAWLLSYSVLQDADVATIEAWFHWAWGRYKAFTFVDPEDSVSYANVRFDQDSLLIDYRGFNQTAVQVRLTEFFPAS